MLNVHLDVAERESDQNSNGTTSRQIAVYLAPSLNDVAKPRRQSSGKRTRTYVSHDVSK